MKQAIRVFTISTIILVMSLAIMSFSKSQDAKAAVPPCEEACEAAAWECDYVCNQEYPEDPFWCIRGCFFAWNACLAAC